MIRVDAGHELHELLIRAEQLGGEARLDIVVPFFDADSRLWRSMIAAAETGSCVRLLTRPATNALEASHFGDLAELGVRTVFLPGVHAKAVLLSDRCGRYSMGWVGSPQLHKGLRKHCPGARGRVWRERHRRGSFASTGPGPI